MNKKKELIILGIVTLVLLVTLGVTYAIFTFSKTSGKSELIAGDIYMRYKETKGITLSNAMPRTNYDPNGYFEFTIEGKNTYTEKDIIYDVVLEHGDAPSDANRTIRIEDKYLHFRLVEVVNNDEQEIFNDKKYDNIQNKRIYVNTIPKNTTTNTSHVYRLYMWIGSEVGIGNTEDATYSTSDWNKVYASVKVNVTGDFSEKEVEKEPTDASCFETEFFYELNENMTNNELQACVNYLTDIWGVEEEGNTVDVGETYQAFCNGTGTSWGSSFQFFLDNELWGSTDKEYFVENNILKLTNEISILNYNTDCGTDVIIPNKINNYNVTTIRDGAFQENQLTSVEIPNSVTTIGNDAFNNNQLTSVVIPDSIKTIGWNSFRNNKLVSVKISEMVSLPFEEICDAFDSGISLSKGNSTNVCPTHRGCFGYEILNDEIQIRYYNEECGTDVIIPNKISGYPVTSLKGGVCYDDELGGDFSPFHDTLTSVKIPNTVTSIENGTFCDNRLKSVEIPNSVTTIGKSAFYNNQLTSVTIGNSVTTIGEDAFYQNQLTSVVIPSSVKTIGEGAFYNNKLTSVTIGNGITSIARHAFIKTSFSNPNLTSITIDKSCNEIKNNLLSGGTNYYPWLSSSSPYTASGVTVYGSGNEVCDTFN